MIDIAGETSDFRHPEFLSGDSLLMSAFSLPKTPSYLTVILRCFWKAPLPRPAERDISIFGRLFSSDHFWRRASSPQSGDIMVSCYALFKGWLLLSQPTSCIGNATTFSLKSHLGTLDESLGCFPLAEIRLSGLDWLSNSFFAYLEFSWSWSLTLSKPSSRSTPRKINNEAIPKYISRRTSYLWVR